MIKESFRLLENNEKFRNLKISFEEKAANENELKQMLRVSVQKNNEYDEVIQDLNKALQRLKREVTEVIAEKEQMSREVPYINLIPINQFCLTYYSFDSRKKRKNCPFI